MKPLRHAARAKGNRGVPGPRQSPCRIAPAAFVLLCVLAACSRGADRARVATPPPTATAAAIAPTASGILNPPQTPRPIADDAARQRAEAFLNKIALQEADLPPSFTRRADAHGAVRPPTQPSRLTLSAATAFGQDQPPGSASAGVQQVAHTGFVFVSADDARQFIRDLGSMVLNAADGGHPERVDAPRLGDEAHAWRVQTADGVTSIIAVRRGPAVFAVTVQGSGSAPETMARDLAHRLDQRTAAALAGGGP